MSRRLPTTPRSRVRNALRQLFLRSRERATVIKAVCNTCQHCGRKGSVAKGREVKIQVHHNPPINWDGIVNLIIERVLAGPYVVLCKECHDNEHAAEGKTK